FKILFDGYSPPVSNRQIIEKDRDEFFIATYSGIYQYPHTKKKPVLIDANREDTVFPLYTRALLYDTAYLYAGTESHSNFFYRVDLNTQTCEGYFFKTIPAGEQIAAIYGLMKDNNGIIWLATDLGLASYNKNKELVTLHTHDKFNVGKTRLFYISRSRTKGKFWVSGRNAFYLVDENKGVEKRYTSESLSKELIQFITDDFIFIDEDAKGKLWIGTKKSGIIVFDTKNDTYENISRSDGLSANEAYGVLWQNDSTAWISTINGLCRYNTSGKTFNNYFYDDGLSDNEFNQNSLLKGSNGNFYFGGINGINYFNPENIKESRSMLTVFLASVVKWNQGLQTFENAINNGRILMSPQDHLLTFTFGLSDFSQTEGHSYFYRIKGLYDNWVSLGNQNILRLEGLPAGSYKVEVMGYNKKGARSQNVLEYTIEIEQVFYKIWWFYILIAVGVVLMVYGYFKWRLRNIDLKLKLRTQIASNLHDEVGSLLTSIIISTDSARYSSNTIEEKNNKLEKISMLSRDATSTMSDVLWSIDSRNDYAGNLTDRMREQAEAMLLPLDIEVEFDFTATQQDQNLNPDTRQQLYLIFKEAINNIAKHSKATVVKVSYKQQGNNFELAIQNNNHAREGENVIYSGQGIKNMQMRAKKIGARCVFDKAGTVYKIIINN
ncbi:MAG: triple tyrosine motif-containing protein, partial [Bacteroidota bacterium]